MNIATTLNDIQYAASICLKCGSCTYGDWPENHRLCSLYYRDECFTHGGGGFMSIVTALAEGLLTLDQKTANLAYTCSGCLVCDSRCSVIKNHPPQVEMMDMIRLLRREAVKKGLAPKASGTKSAGEEYALPAGTEDDKAQDVLFLGAGESGAGLAPLGELLGKMGMRVALFKEDKASGAALYDNGYWDGLKSAMEANWNRMKAYEGKTFVFSDPHAEEFIARRYPENIAGCAGIKHQHLSEVLAAALKGGKLKSKATDKVRVSYHDPCYLGRGLGIYEPPREVLTALPGVELVEMARNRKSAYCCGAGSTGDYFPDHSGYMAKERMNEFEATGADILVTACQKCTANLRKAMPESGKARIVDLLEFVNTRV